MNNLKVLHITTSLNGGAGICCKRYYESQKDAGYMVDIFSLVENNESVTQAIWKNRLKTNRKIVYLNLTLSFFYNIIRKIFQKLSFLDKYNFFSYPFFGYMFDLNKIIESYDIVHLHWVHDFLSIQKISKINKPIVWTQHDTALANGWYNYDLDRLDLHKYSWFKSYQKNSLSSTIQDYINKKKWKILSNKKDIFFTFPTKWLFDKFENISSFQSYNSSIVEQIIPKNNKLNYFDDEENYYVFIAHAIEFPVKGYFLLKKAVEILKSKNININIKTIGRTNLSSSDNINHLGFIQNKEIIDETLARAKAIIVPSIADVGPMVVQESLLNGTPVIIFEQGAGASSLINDGLNGIKIKDLTSDSLADGLIKFESLKFKKDKVFNDALEKVDNKKTIDQLNLIYKEMSK